MNLSGRKVKFLKLHSPLFFNGQQSGNTFTQGPVTKEGFKNVSMTLTDQGILISTTGKDAKNTRVFEVLVTTYECAELEPIEEAAKAVKK